MRGSADPPGTPCALPIILFALLKRNLWTHTLVFQKIRLGKMPKVKLSRGLSWAERVIIWQTEKAIKHPQATETKYYPQHSLASLAEGMLS